MRKFATDHQTTGASNRVAVIPNTVTTAAVKACNPPSIAEDDIPFASGTAEPSMEMRRPSPNSLQAKPSCPTASETSCAPKLRDQERALISHAKVCRQAHVLIS